MINVDKHDTKFEDWFNEDNPKDKNENCRDIETISVDKSNEQKQRKSSLNIKNNSITMKMSSFLQELKNDTLSKNTNMHQEGLMENVISQESSDEGNSNLKPA